MEAGKIKTRRLQVRGTLELTLAALLGILGNGLLLSILILIADVGPAILILYGIVWVIFLAVLLRLPAIRLDAHAQTHLALGFGLLLAVSVLLYQFAYPQLSIAQWPNNLADIDYIGHDSLRYTVWIERVANLWKAGGSYTDAGMPLAQLGFPLFFAVLYTLLGAEPLIIILVNVLMVGLAAICTYEVAWFWRERPLQARDRTPHIAALLMLVSPLVIIQGAAIPMKEAIVLFLTIGGVLAIEHLRRRLSLKALLLLGLMMVLLLDMRFYMVLVLAAYAAYRLAARYLNVLRPRNLFFIGAIGMVAALLAFRIASGPLNSVLQGDSQSYQAAFASYSQSGSITAALFWRGSLALSFLIPVRAAVLLFNPLPPIYFSDYHVGSESANVLFVILLLPFVLERLRQALGRRQPGHLGYLLPMVLGLCVVSALLPISSPRFLVPIMPYYVIGAAQGIVYCKSSWRTFYVIWLVGLALVAAVLYTGIKLVL